MNLFVHLPMLIGAADPLGNFSKMLTKLYDTSMKVGPKLGVVALIIAILAGVFLPGKDPKQHWFKCIGIGLGIVCLLNIGYVIGFFQWIFFTVLGDDKANEGIKDVAGDIESTIALCINYFRVLLH